GSCRSEVPGINTGTDSAPTPFGAWAQTLGWTSTSTCGQAITGSSMQDSALSSSEIRAAGRVNYSWGLLPADPFLSIEGVSRFDCSFTVTAPTPYTLAGSLNRAFVNSGGNHGLSIFLGVSPTSPPIFFRQASGPFSTSGTLQPGNYR